MAAAGCDEAQALMEADPGRVRDTEAVSVRAQAADPGGGLPAWAVEDGGEGGRGAPGGGVSRVREEGGGMKPVRIQLSRKKGWRMPPNRKEIP